MSRALLVIDVQNEYFTGALPITHPVGHLESILRVMDAAEGKVPRVFVQHHMPTPDALMFRKGSPEWELHPEVAGRPRDLLVEKTLPGSFTGTPLEDWLREHDIDTVTVAGYMSHMCCDTTARQAVHLGFKVEFLADATGTLPLVVREVEVAQLPGIAPVEPLCSTDAPQRSGRLRGVAHPHLSRSCNISEKMPRSR